MNSLFIPALAGQIYAMPGMETRLHAVANTAGDYQGFSANYSGRGFSGMHFMFRALADRDFEQWLARMRAGGGVLQRSDYLRLERPSENEPVRGFAAVDPSLYQAILNRCVEAGKACANDMMMMDATSGLHTSDSTTLAGIAGPPMDPVDGEPLLGAGLMPPLWVFRALPTPSLALRPAIDP
jgi:cytochrome o ubiquinol oxidase subunit 2